MCVVRMSSVVNMSESLFLPCQIPAIKLATNQYAMPGAQSVAESAATGQRGRRTTTPDGTLAPAAAGPSLASSEQAQVMDLAAADVLRPPEDPPPVEPFREVVTMLREFELPRARGHVGRAEFVTLRVQIQGQATRLAGEVPGGAPRPEEARRHERRRPR